MNKIINIAAPLLHKDNDTAVAADRGNKRPLLSEVAKAIYCPLINSAFFLLKNRRHSHNSLIIPYCYKIIHLKNRRKDTYYFLIAKNNLRKE
jgi:hypothetical protein